MFSQLILEVWQVQVILENFWLELLSDQFVSGIQCRDTQKISSSDKTHEECVKTAIADEAVTKETF